MAARKNRGTKDNPWHETVRERLRASMLEKKLLEHIDGKREMSTTQFSAAKTLLAKILPDLTETETKVSGELTVNIVQYAGRQSPK